MPIGDICVRDVVVVERNTTIQEAARLMRQHHVGDLVIVEGRVPVGIVTDRDITVSVVGTSLDPTVFTVGDLILDDLVTAQEDQGIFESIQKMSINGVRRMPVVDRDGNLAGILSVDDLIQLLAKEMGALSKLITYEQVREAERKQ